MITLKFKIKTLFVLCLFTLNFSIANTFTDFITFVKSAQKNLNAIVMTFPLSRHIIMSMINEVSSFAKQNENKIIKILEVGSSTETLSENKKFKEKNNCIHKIVFFKYTAMPYLPFTNYKITGN